MRASYLGSRKASSYNRKKKFKGKTYTGMKVGHMHDWEYNGRWKEKKVTPKDWHFAFAAIKSRKGIRLKDDKGGLPIGTGIVWKIEAIQMAKKISPNKYKTMMIGKKRLKKIGRGVW